MLIGIDYSVVNNKPEKPKGIGMSRTLPVDVSNLEQLEKILLNLTEEVCFRLRKQNMKAGVVNVQLRTKDFVNFSHQEKLIDDTDFTKEIYSQAKKLLSEMYVKGMFIRLIGIRLDKLSDVEEGQMSIFEMHRDDKQSNIDKTLDDLKQKYGFGKISRASNINQKFEGRDLYK